MIKMLKLTVFCYALAAQFCAVFAYDAVLDEYIPAADRPHVIDMVYYAIVTDDRGNTKYSAWLLTAERMSAPACERTGLRFVATHGAPHPRNYAASGYDTGHLCPAEDMRFAIDAMRATFDTINAIPQTPRLNRGVWKSLETQCRKWASAGNELILIAGPLYRAQPPPVIGPDKIRVPSHCFKLVINRTTGETAGYIFPNTPDISGVPAQFRTETAQVKQVANL